MLNKLFRIIKNPKILLSYFLMTKYSCFISDKTCLKILFKLKMGKTLNLDNPKTFNEKLQWLKIYQRDSTYSSLVDKYEVRQYIEKSLGADILIPLLGVWDCFEDIDFDQLPSQFVLKCTHDSGGLVICTDKSKLDIAAAKKKINKCLKRNYYYNGREWPYKNIKPKIICEKFMVDESGVELKDYKFLCFNGKVKCSFVCLNRNKSTGLNVDFYDMDWKPMPFERHYSCSDTVISKPINFDKMVEFAEILSKNIPFVRVDFYETNGQLYFGELTFYPGGGFEEFTPESYDYLLGSWMELPIG